MRHLYSVILFCISITATNISGSVISAHANSKTVMPEPYDIRDIFNVAGIEKDYLELERIILDEFAIVPRFSIRISGDSVHKFHDTGDQFQILKAKLSSFLTGQPDWEVYSVTTSDSVKLLKEATIVDLMCATSDFSRCLATFNRKGSDQTTIQEINFRKGTLIANGFSLPFGYNAATYLKRGSSSIVFYHDTERRPSSIQLWTAQDGKGHISTLLNTPEKAVEVSFNNFGKNAGVRVRFFYKERLADEYHIDKEGRVTLSNLSYYAENTLPDIYRSCIVLFANNDHLYCEQATNNTIFIGGKETTIPARSIVAVPFDIVTKSDVPVSFIRSIYTPHKEEIIEDVIMLANGIIIRLYVPARGENKLLYVSPEGITHSIDLPAIGSIDEITPSIDEDAFLFVRQTLIDLPQYYFFRAQKPFGNSNLTTVWHDSIANSVGKYITETRYIERDGIKLFYDIVGKKEVIEKGKAPSIITAYGHYYHLTKPAYKPGLKEGWLDQGGIYVVAHPRGGGAYTNKTGFDPEASALDRRQITVDDFTAFAHDLVASGLSAPDNLHAEGSSAGGSLVTLSALQNPGLFKSVVALAACLDPNIKEGICHSRYFSPIVSSSTNVLETDTAIKARLVTPMALIDPSLPQNTKTAFLLIGNENDERVSLKNSKHFAARLVKAGYPVYTLFNEVGGHQIALSETEYAAIRAAVWLFFQGKINNHTFLSTIQSNIGYNGIAAKLHSRLKQGSTEQKGCDANFTNDVTFQNSMRTIINKAINISAPLNFCIIDTYKPIFSFLEPSLVIVSTGLLNAMETKIDLIGTVLHSIVRANHKLQNVEEFHKDKEFQGDTRLAELAIMAAVVAGVDIKGDENNGTSYEALIAPSPYFTFDFDGSILTDNRIKKPVGQKTFNAFVKTEKKALAAVKNVLGKHGVNFENYLGFLLRTKAYNYQTGIRLEDIAQAETNKTPTLPLQEIELCPIYNKIVAYSTVPSLPRKCSAYITLMNNKLHRPIS